MMTVEKAETRSGEYDLYTSYMLCTCRYLVFNSNETTAVIYSSSHMKHTNRRRGIISLMFREGGARDYD